MEAKVRTKHEESKGETKEAQRVAGLLLPCSFSCVFCAQPIRRGEKRRVRGFRSNPNVSFAALHLSILPACGGIPEILFLYTKILDPEKKTFVVERKKFYCYSSPSEPSQLLAVTPHNPRVPRSTVERKKQV